MPKLLEFNLHFYLSNLDCDIAINNNQKINIIWLDYNYFYITLYNENNDIIEKNFDKLHFNDLTNSMSKKLNYDLSNLKNIIEKGNKIYKDL